MIFDDLLKAFIHLLQLLIHAYIIIILIRSVLSWAGHLPGNRIIYFLKKITDPVFRFVHKYVPFTIIGNIDISPILIIFVLYFVNNLLSRWLATMVIRGG